MRMSPGAILFTFIALHFVEFLGYTDILFSIKFSKILPIFSSNIFFNILYFFLLQYSSPLPQDIQFTLIPNHSILSHLLRLLHFSSLFSLCFSLDNFYCSAFKFTVYFVISNVLFNPSRTFKFFLYCAVVEFSCDSYDFYSFHLFSSGIPYFFTLWDNIFFKYLTYLSFIIF